MQPRSQFIEILGSRMHYLQAGQGDPILFLHGNPTSSYLWRNILPYLIPHGRCIAPDLIGMGQSDKPDIAYRFFDHYQYLEAFIDRLGLRNLTLVMHDWGSALGFHYARRHPDNIHGLAFMEAMVKPLHWRDFPADFKLGFRLMRLPVVGWLLVSVGNVFVRQILPKAVCRSLTAEEKAAYAAPFPTIPSRRPVRQWPREIPIDGRPADVHRVMEEYSQWLQTTDLPKLLLYAEPGGIIDARTRQWCQSHLGNLRMVNVGRGIHYLQEDHPDAIGEAVAEWYLAL